MTAEHESLVGEVSEWFAAHGRPLPWREEFPGPWGILLVEVMSQQTPIARVAPVWQEWLARWPRPADLASATPAEVIRAWGRMGYPRRALQLRQAAALICEEFGGRVPRSETDLLTLPGVGPYTAAAVRAFAFGERAVVLDTNIRRVLTRVLDGVALPRPHLRVSERTRAERLVPIEPERAVAWNAAVMEFGALVCTARAPQCGRCPVSLCQWREAGFPDNAPVRRPQPWAGSDRQLRGVIMAQLREHSGALAHEELLTAVRHRHPGTEASRVEEILAGLITDSLIERTSGTGADRRYRLPQ